MRNSVKQQTIIHGAAANRNFLKLQMKDSLYYLVRVYQTSYSELAAKNVHGSEYNLCF